MRQAGSARSGEEPVAGPYSEAVEAVRSYYTYRMSVFMGTHAVIPSRNKAHGGGWEIGIRL